MGALIQTGALIRTGALIWENTVYQVCLEYSMK